MTFEEMIDELQERFIFNIRKQPTLMGKLYAVWFREEIKQGRRVVEPNDQQ